MFTEWLVKLSFGEVACLILVIGFALAGIASAIRGE